MKKEIVCTLNHRIFVKNKGWIKASQIIESDKTLLYNNDEAKVIRKTIQKLDEYDTIYNFEVEELHNYYVGNLNVLVHNDCVTTPDGKPLYRGGNKFKLRGQDYALDGDYFETMRKGPSVNTSINETASHGKPHKLIKMPDGLGLKQDGNDPGHYIIVPTRKMHLDEFRQLLNEIVLE
ncbi:MAG: Hint domain-containing protein [Bacilli bacterium]